MNPSILASAVVSGRNLNSERWMIFLSLAYVFLLANVTYAKPVPNPTHASNTPRSARATRGKCINNAPNSDVHSAVTHLTLEVAAMDEYVKVLAHNSVEISSAIKAIYQAMCSEENQNSDRAFLARMQSKGTLGESEKINHEILGYINQITSILGYLDHSALTIAEANEAATTISALRAKAKPLNKNLKVNAGVP